MYKLAALKRMAEYVDEKHRQLDERLHKDQTAIFQALKSKE